MSTYVWKNSIERHMIIVNIPFGGMVCSSRGGKGSELRRVTQEALATSIAFHFFPVWCFQGIFYMIFLCISVCLIHVMLFLEKACFLRYRSN